MDIKEIFRKYLNDEASPEEKAVVEHWVYGLFEKIRSRTATAEEIALVDDWVDQFNVQGIDPKVLAEKMGKDQAAVWDALQEYRHQTEKNNNSPKKSAGAVLKYAAILIAILAVPVLIYIAGSRKEVENRHLLAPAVTDNGATYLACNKGEHAKLFILPDSTRLYLNSNSLLVYDPGSYNRENRRVKLEKGAAFFEVTKNTAKPFIVQTDSLTVTVTGTSFEVVFLPGLHKNSVSVRSGSVAVSRKGQPVAALQAGQALLQNPTSGGFEVQPAAEALAQWTSGALVFSNAGISEIKYLLENRFDKKVTDKTGKLNSGIKFNATFNGDAPLTEIAAALSSLYNVQYSVEKDSLVFY
ncbi:FecR family protein [Niabella sp.]|uniref:FecR family protein n=1 Tax=Niabella sp. TaxID=1962976 RepID=UPI0026275381|nr:FecR family protein [Niabella sp.]